jgi:hypothetical protein
MVQLIFVKFTVHPALHIVTTESNECDARPGMTWATWVPAGIHCKLRVKVCVDCTLSPFGRQAMRGTAARTMFVAGASVVSSLSAMDGHDRPLNTSFVVLWFLAKFLSVHGV